MWQIVQLAVTIAIAILMRPQPPETPITPHDTNSVPTAAADRAIPVLFGTMTTSAPNVVWYGDLYLKVLKKEGSKGK